MDIKREGNRAWRGSSRLSEKESQSEPREVQGMPRSCGERQEGRRQWSREPQDHLSGMDDKTAGIERRQSTTLTSS